MATSGYANEPPHATPVIPQRLPSRKAGGHHDDREDPVAHPELRLANDRQNLREDRVDRAERDVEAEDPQRRHRVDPLLAKRDTDEVVCHEAQPHGHGECSGQRERLGDAQDVAAQADMSFCTAENTDGVTLVTSSVTFWTGEVERSHATL